MKIEEKKDAKPAPYGSTVIKLAVTGIIVILVIYALSAIFDTDTTQEPIAQASDTASSAIEAGAFTYDVKGVKVVDSPDNVDSQYVVVSVKYTNNDDRARDFSYSLFTVTDDAGKSYSASMYTSFLDDYLTYETLNPGLSKTSYVAFETPKGVSGLQLHADSGLLLAGGSSVTIDLGK